MVNSNKVTWLYSVVEWRKNKVAATYLVKHKATLESHQNGQRAVIGKAMLRPLSDEERQEREFEIDPIHDFVSMTRNTCCVVLHVCTSEGEK